MLFLQFFHNILECSKIEVLAPPPRPKLVCYQKLDHFGGVRWAIPGVIVDQNTCKEPLSTSPEAANQTAKGSRESDVR